ncbi:MAG: hypothetical protein COV44_09005 [Deltaproteobacteria bacterium CG11_big_fil_rev_8_21_14_0_20_45_16]|nr:MAG: hypothetical protein COV44_09005 [Deltaproteobacteria bacterium CG11_big_fil_rev_8_21_14_0_20_45_16]
MTNYRDFLRSFVEYLRATSNEFSFRKFSKLAGFSSSATLKLLIDNKTNLSDKGVQKVAKGLGLKIWERDCFFHLVKLNQSKSLEERQEHYEALLKQKRYSRHYPLARAQYSYYARWYYPVIRELIGLENFREDSGWIAKQLSPPITAPQVSEAINHLLELGLIIREKGRLLQARTSMTTGNEVSSTALMAFHKVMMAKAIEAQIEVSPEFREISSLTITLPQDQVSKLKEMIIKFRREIFDRFGEAGVKDDAVYQINFQMYPLTKIKSDS